MNSPLSCIKFLSSSPDIIDGDPGSSFGGRVVARVISANSGDGGSARGRVNDSRESLGSAEGREGRWRGVSSCPGDSNGVMPVIWVGMKEDSELRFESEETYAESCRLFWSASLLFINFGLTELTDLGKEASEPVSLVYVCHLGGRGRIGVGCEVGGIAWDVASENDLPLLRSAAFLNASNSGFGSKVICFGKAAAKDFTEELGLQFSLASPDDSLGSLPGSITSPK